MLKIAKLWNVRLMAEEELPPHRKNVIKCEDNNSAFYDLKKREYFLNLDMTKVELKNRMKVIRKVLYTLDKHHKQTLRFLQDQGPKMLKRSRYELRENIMDSDDDSEYAL